MKNYISLRRIKNEGFHERFFEKCMCDGIYIWSSNIMEVFIRTTG